MTAVPALLQLHISIPAMGLSAEALIKNASQTEKTIVNKDFSHLNNLSPKVVLHQDGFTLNKDIEGEEAVKKYLAAYFEKYDYSHETLMYAVNEKTKASFALAYDKVISLQPVFGHVLLVLPVLRQQKTQLCSILPVPFVYEVLYLQCHISALLLVGATCIFKCFTTSAAVLHVHFKHLVSFPARSPLPCMCTGFCASCKAVNLVAWRCAFCAQILY